MLGLRGISCVFTVCLLARLANAFVQRSMSLDGSLTNLQFYDGKLYIGGTDRIYVINEDLSIYQSFSTCDRPKTTCGNVNQLLLVNKIYKELLVCGTGNDGICKVRKLNNINMVSKIVLGIRPPLRVSSDASRPVQALVTQNGNLTVAVTYGKGINVTETRRPSYLSYKYAISTRNFDDFEPVSSKAGTKVLNVEIKDTKFHDYTIYYKAGFQYNWYTYFVTNQKDYVGGSYYLSKLVRLCQNDTAFNSYTDIVLQCMHNGTAYNLIQDATLLRRRNMPKNASSDAIFVGAFFRGNDPNKPTGDSVVCMSMLKDLDHDILIAKKNHALSCDRQDPTRRYLPDRTPPCTSSNEKDFLFGNYYASCEQALPSFAYVIGNITISMESVYKVNARDGFITTVSGEVTVKRDNLVFIGTSKGNIFQMSQSNLNSSLDVFSQVNVGDAVRRIYIKDEDTFYVMSNRRVFLLQRSNCSEFNTCYDTVKGRNPRCGWCVYKQRATKRTDCPTAPNHWISSLQNCKLNMSVTPSSIPVLESSKTNVSLTIRPGILPEPLDGDKYLCNLLNGSGVIATLVPQMKEEAFICTLPRIKYHTEATLQLVVQTLFMNTAVLSTSPVLFFDCQHFSRCSECISPLIQNCVWCIQDASCKDKGSPCSSELNKSTDVCPRLQDMRGQYFVHTGVMTSVNLHAEHIPKTAYVYTCSVLAFTHSSTTVKSGDSILCNINITNELNVPKQDYKVKVNYAAQGPWTAELDDNYGNFVTVYNCSLLATDCSHCQALNRSRYNCGWYANKAVCGYADESCVVEKCPAPTLTKVVPVDGPTIGQTKITVFGYNLGSDISDIESIEVANVPCKLSKNTNDYLVTKSADFKSHPPSRIVCYTGPSENETSGFMKMTVKGKVSVSPFRFSYKKPVITSIHPRYGPKAGGTRITIDGQNLGIGYRNVSVMLGYKHCLRPAVSPDIPLDHVFSGYCTIVCTVDVGYFYNITDMSLSIDGAKVIYWTPVSFFFVENPLIHTITPKKGFLSGGTKISIEGKDMNNANEARVTIKDEGETVVGECEIKSGTLVICKVPRAPEAVADELLDTDGSSECPGCIRKTAVLNLDNVREVFEVEFYRDPEINSIDEENGVIKLKSSQRRLTISGKRLNQVATIFDINVTVGIETCVLAQLKPLFISCIAPTNRPEPGISNAELPEVNICYKTVPPMNFITTFLLLLANHLYRNALVSALANVLRKFRVDDYIYMYNYLVEVTIGNVRKTVGYVKYEYEDDDINYAIVKYEIVSVVTAVVLTFVICLSTVLLYRRNRRTKSKLKSLVKENSPKLGRNMNTVMGNSREITNVENNELYAEIYDSCLTDINNSLNENLDSPTLQEPRANEKNLTNLYITPVNRNSFRLRHEVNMQIDFEKDDKEDGDIASKVLDADFYLHPISCEDSERPQNGKEHFANDEDNVLSEVYQNI